MPSAKEIQVLLSPRTTEVLRLGLIAIFRKELEDGLHPPIEDNVGISGLDMAARVRLAKQNLGRMKVDDFLSTSIGKNMQEHYIQKNLQEMQLDHAVRSFKKSNPWYAAVSLNLLASAIGALLGPLVLAGLSHLSKLYG